MYWLIDMKDIKVFWWRILWHLEKPDFLAKKSTAVLFKDLWRKNKQVICSDLFKTKKNVLCSVLHKKVIHDQTIQKN